MTTASCPGQHSTTLRGIPWANDFSNGEKRTRGTHSASPAFLGRSLEAHFCLGEPRGIDKPRPHGGNWNKEGSRAHSNQAVDLGSGTTSQSVTLLKEVRQWLLPPMKQSRHPLWPGSTVRISVWLGSSVNGPAQLSAQIVVLPDRGAQSVTPSNHRAWPMTPPGSKARSPN